MRLIRWVPLVFLGGCQTMVPVGNVTPVPGRTIVVHLQEPIEFQAAEARLQNLVRMRGMFMTNHADSLIVRASDLWSASGVRHSALGARVAVPRSSVSQIEEQRTSAWRSALIAGAGVAALALVVFSVDAGLGGEGPGTPPPGQQ